MLQFDKLRAFYFTKQEKCETVFLQKQGKIIDFRQKFRKNAFWKEMGATAPRV